MNYTELSRMVRMLSPDCHAARLNNVVDGPNTVYFLLTRYLETGESLSRRSLVLDFERRHLDLYALARLPRAPKTPQAFTMLLRKHLAGQRISSIRMSCCDRVVTFDFGPDVAPRNAFVAEFTGGRPNAFLLELPSYRILGSIWRDGQREVHGIYAPPCSPETLQVGTDRFSAVPDEDYFAQCERFYVSRDRDERLCDARASLARRLSAAGTRLQRRREAFARDLEKAESTTKDRREADLLSAYAFQISRGTEIVSLPDFETGESVTIRLSPGLSVRENIEQRYRRCKRLTRSLPQVRDRLGAADRQLEFIRETKELLDAAQNIDQILELESKSRRILDQLLPKTQNPSKPRDPVEAHKPYKTFTSACGLTILVGKTASDNDFLTFRVAKGNDWWLHAAHVPGSHVVIRSPSPDSETLLDAATLAVHYSKLAQNESADVQITQQKNVRRAKDAPAGKVDLRGEKVVRIDVEEKRLKRLLATEV